MQFPILALDIGFGLTKMAVRYPEDLNLFTDAFPSIALRVVGGVPSEIPSPEARRTYFVTVNKINFAVGPDVKFLLGGGTGSGRNLADDFPMSCEYEALFLGALLHVKATEVDVLVMGLPVHTINKYMQHLVTKFTGKFFVGNRQITIKQILILPLPLGAMFHYGSTIDYSLRDNEMRLTVDCGYLTTDWVVTSNYRIHGGRSDGVSKGILSILSAVSALISKHSDTPFANLERLDDSLLNSKELRIFRKKMSLEKLNFYVKNSSYVIDNCVKEIGDTVGDFGDLSSILVCGGGAEYFLPSIKKTFPDVDIVLLENSPFCNVRGFLLFGESRLRRGLAGS